MAYERRMHDAFVNGSSRGGKEETRLFLEKLGFVVGSSVTVISEAAGNIIVNIKESRVAIGKDMANKIMV